MAGDITIELVDVLRIAGIVISISAVLSIILAIWVVRRIRRINLPPDADAITALQLTPLSVVVLLDLLDFTFDFLSAPVSWAILGYLGLKPLRGVTIVESFIPGTQAIPTMTIGWIIVRLVKPRQLKALEGLRRIQ